MASLATLNLFIIIVLVILTDIDAKQYAAHSRRRCIPEISVAWSHELSSGPFASTPIVTDIDIDGELDIAVTSFLGQVDVVRAKDGQRQPGSFWPYRLSRGSFYASPLQYDVNRDGILDVLTSSSLGQLHFLHYNGRLIKEYQLSRVRVSRDWFRNHSTVGIRLVHNFVSLASSFDEQTDHYVYLDPHILATPVIDDVNGDGIMDELVVPVTYYLDPDDYSDVDALFPVSKDVNVSDYVLSSLVYFNLTSMSPYQTVFLDLTKMSSEYRAYLFSSPTVADIDQTLPGLETVIGTSAGYLHFIGFNGNSIEPFPLKTGVIQSQVVLEDVDSNGDLEIIVQEVGGRVVCYDLPSGIVVWEKQLSGDKPLGVRLIDLDNDLHLDLLVAAQDGNLWVLDAASGEVHSGWPVSVDSHLTSVSLVTRLHGLNKILYVNLDHNGVLHIMSADRTCQYKVSLHETSFVSLLSHDLLPGVPGLELLVAAADGALLCLKADNYNDEVNNDDVDEIKTVAWPAEQRTHNDFTFSEFLILTIDGVPLPEVTTSSFTLQFSIVDVQSSSVSPYLCQIYVGSTMLHSMVIMEAGSQSVDVASPQQPLIGHLVLECRTRNGKILRDIAVVRFNKTFLFDLQWLLVGPTIALLLLLVFFHGFPAADILPVTFRNKNM